MMDDCYAGASRYINDRTGVFLKRASIGRMTRTFLDAHERYQPREWIRHRASFQTSLRDLEAHFRAAALERDAPWRESLIPVTRRYQKLRYANPADAARVADAAADFARAYRIKLG
jgi:hypothetical protein